MKKNLQVWLILIVALAVSCEEAGDSDGYYFEDEYEEEYGEGEYLESETPTKTDAEIFEDAGFKAKASEVLPEDIEEKGVTEVQDQEFNPNSVTDLISTVLTDGKLDTQKVVASIFNNLKYISKQPVGIGFACEYYGYFTTNLLIPMQENEHFVSMYLPRKVGQKKYHFILMNFKGAISCKRYAVNCSRSTMSYAELFVFLPEEPEQRTQCGMIIAIADEYLKDIKTRLNINYRIGEEEAATSLFGNAQYFLEKSIPAKS